MKDKFTKPSWSGLMSPRIKKNPRTICVFQGFMGEIAFIAYALPLMLAMILHHRIVRDTDKAERFYAKLRFTNSRR
jgi:hypothetical protein